MTDLSDLAKLKAILERRQLDTIMAHNGRYYFVNYWNIERTAWSFVREFDPFNDIRDAMRLLEGMDYRVIIDTKYTSCELWTAEPSGICCEDGSPARAITEAVYLAVCGLDGQSQS